MKLKFLVILCCYFLFCINTKAFVDIKDNFRYYESINFLKNQGVIKGYGNDDFQPMKYITRAEFLKIILESLNYKIEKKYENCFSDVKNEWFSKYVCFSKENGFIKGYGNKFEPYNEILFVESAKIINLIIKQKCEIDVKYCVFENFNFHENHGYFWYKDYVENLSKKFILPETIIKIDQKINRSEMSEIIFRSLPENINQNKNKKYVTYNKNKNFIENTYIYNNDFKNYDFNFQENIPILMFHYIKDVSKTNNMEYNLSYSPELLEKLILFCNENKIEIITFWDLKLILEEKITKPKKAVIFTFDDGYKDHYYNAYKILEKYNKKGVFYIVSNKPNNDENYMNWNEIVEMSNNGHEIASHTVSHANLTILSDNQINKELKNSKEKIEREIQKPVISLSYPAGKYNENIANIAKELYIFSRTTEYGKIFSIKNRHKLKTIRMLPSVSFKNILRY